MGKKIISILNRSRLAVVLIWALLVLPAAMLIPEKKLVDILALNSIDISEILIPENKDGVVKMGGILSESPASVIAIGEQSHGTSEFFKIRTEIIKILTRDQRVDKIGLEAPFSEVEDLNSYLHQDRGNLREILKSFRLYSYECEEFIDFVNQIKEINKKRQSKITFFGFDMQSPFKSLERIRDLSKQDSSIPGDTIKKLLHYYSLLNEQVFAHNFSKEDFDSLKYISQPVIARQSNASVNKSVHAFQASYRQFLLLNDPDESNQDVNKMSEIRDSLMAENVMAHRDKNSKIIILAHNGHVQKNRNTYSKTMGYFLNKKLGENYLTIGLTTSEGFYTAFNPSAGKIVNNNPIATADTNSFEHYFSILNKPVLFFNNRNISLRIKENERPKKYKLLPYGLIENQFTSGDAFDDFDYIIHVQQTKGNKSFYLN